MRSGSLQQPLRPFQAFLINQTLTGGFRRGAPIALTSLIADIPIVIAILILLDQLPPAFLRGVSLVGIAALFHQARRLGPRVVRLLTLASILILIVFWGVLLKQGLSP